MFEPTPKDFWRAIVLYGNNMSTYKMGLGHLLINYANKNSQKIPLRDLSEDFLGLYQNRIKNGKPQSRRKIINGTEFYISSTFIYEPFEITGTFIDKTKPDDCHKVWKTDTIMVEPDRTLGLWLENYHNGN